MPERSDDPPYLRVEFGLPRGPRVGYRSMDDRHPGSETVRRAEDRADLREVLGGRIMFFLNYIFLTNPQWEDSQQAWQALSFSGDLIDNHVDILREAIDDSLRNFYTILKERGMDEQAIAQLGERIMNVITRTRNRREIAVRLYKTLQAVLTDPALQAVGERTPDEAHAAFLAALLEGSNPPTTIDMEPLRREPEE